MRQTPVFPSHVTQTPVLLPPFPLLAAAFCAALSVALVAGPALSAESEISLTSLQTPGKGKQIGTIHATDSEAGLVLHVEADGLVAGPNRLRLSERPACDYPLQSPSGEIAYRELGILNANITEDGTEPVKATVTLSDLSVADLAGKALVIYAGGQYADTQPQFRSAPQQLACGFVPAQ
jgi:Cu-Zn family superoxide dismutase